MHGRLESLFNGCMRSATFACILLAASKTAAQSNEVFLGQTGDTNTITIDQTGANNLVGGVTDDLRLNQLGDRNAVTILQIGENNGVGRINMVGQAGLLTGHTGNSSGLFQTGDGNVLDVTQRTAQGEGGNLLGSIRQEAGETAEGTANEARVVQIGGAFEPGVSPLGVSTGPGFHTVGEILQIHGPGPEAAGANRLAVEQWGLRQSAGQLWQDGAQNRFTLRQSGEENTLRMGRQAGALHRLDIAQNGRRNTVGSATQDGTGNSAFATLAGEGNLVEEIVQVGVGNGVVVSAIGNDNGGEGIGGARVVSAQGATLAAFAAAIEQYGDGNGFSLTIGADGRGADGNGFSASQTGAGNEAGATLAGHNNLLTLFQLGDGNLADIAQTSTALRGASTAATGNTASLVQIGLGNRLLASQAGAGNSLEVDVLGDRNVFADAPGPDGLRLSVAAAPGLVQDGEGHRASVRVTGDRNAVSLAQFGVGHVIEGIVTGASNVSVVLQSGTANVAEFRQSGDGNYSFIQQD